MQQKNQKQKQKNKQKKTKNQKQKTENYDVEISSILTVKMLEISTS